MWPFNKIYYAEDWGILDYNTISVTHELGDVSVGIEILLKNRRTSKIKKATVGLGFVGCYSWHTVRNKLLTRYGIILNIDAWNFSLPERATEIKDN